jgi:hypothetical protein
MYYIGLDVHKKTISYCVKDASGQIHREGTIGATRNELDVWIKTLPQPWTVAMEATIFTGWIYDHLLPHAAQVKVAHPVMLRAIALARKKNGSGAKTANTEDDGLMQRFAPPEELFKGRHFDQEIVVLCVRWYLSFKLSYRDLVAMMSERGIDLAHTTILRWVQHYTPEFEKRWKRFARPVGGPGEWMRHM